MKIFLLFIVLISTSVKAELWLQYGVNLECPDAIELNNGTYIIYNDCYGFDPVNPVIETGNYRIEGNSIFFKNRNSKVESFLGKNSENQCLEIKSKTKEELHLKNENHAFRFRVRYVPRKPANKAFKQGQLLRSFAAT